MTRLLTSQACLLLAVALCAAPAEASDSPYGPAEPRPVPDPLSTEADSGQTSPTLANVGLQVTTETPPPEITEPPPVEPVDDLPPADADAADSPALVAEAVPQDSNTDQLDDSAAILPAANPKSASLRFSQSREASTPWYRSGFVALGVVLAVIAALSLLLKRLVPSVRTMNGETIQILGRNHLSPKQCLTLVRLGQRVILVGATPERLSTLCIVEDPTEVAAILGTAVGKNARRSPFDAALGDAANGMEGDKDEVAELPGSSTEGLAQAKGQLEGLLARLKAMQAAGSSSG